MISAITTLPCKKLRSFLHTSYIEIPTRKKPGIANIGGYKEYYRMQCQFKGNYGCNTVQQRRNHFIYKLKMPSLCLGKKNE